MDYCLREAKITTRELDLVGFYEKPMVKFERLLETYTASAPRGYWSYLMAMPLWLGEKLWMADDIRDRLAGYEGEVLFGEHHESHAASAFYPSPFEQAAVVTIDGVGEWATSSIGVGRGHDLEILHELRFPHSLGLLYSAFTYFAGFKVNSGEYKVMGLAPYGEPRYVKIIKDHLIEIREDGSLWMNQDYFTYADGLTMTGAMEKLLGGAAAAERRSHSGRWISRVDSEITEEVMLDDGLRHRKPGCAICVWPGASRSIAWGTDASCARGRSSRCGCSRRLATPGGRLASPWRSGIGTSTSHAAVPKPRERGSGRRAPVALPCPVMPTG